MASAKNKIPPEEIERVVAAIDSLKPMLLQQRSAQRSIIDAIEKMDVATISAQRLIGQKKFEMLSEEKWKKELDTYRGEIISGLVSIYASIVGNPVFGYAAPAFPITTVENKELLSMVNALVKDNILYVQTPPLLNRQARYRNTSTGVLYSDHTQIFASEVIKKLADIRDQIPTFLKKNINILCVYHSNRKNPPDVGNLDFKAIVDAISWCFPGSDNARTCSISLGSTIVNSVPEGTYFTITKGLGNVPDFAKNVDEIKTLFKVEKNDK